MRALLALIILTSSSICLQASEEKEIVVRLATENQRIPVYAAKFVDDRAVFSPEYLRQLEAILLFDLNHNGVSSTLPSSPSHESLANQLAVQGGFTEPSKGWKALGTPYVIKGYVEGEKMLSAKLFTANEEGEKCVSGLKLSGKLREDRRQVHKLADAICKALFNVEGIANTRLLYTLRKPLSENRWSSEIWEADYDGENAHLLLSQGGYQLTPVYIPPKPGYQSGSFLYVSYLAAQPKIFISSLKEPKGRQLTALRGNQLTPAISSKRDQIAFISDVTGNPDLFIQEFHPEKGAVGKPRQIFAGKQATQGSPTFSPDGKRLAFVSNKDGVPRVYLMSIPPPGTPLKEVKTQLLSKHTGESSAPAWSPDGSKIAYCAKSGGVRQIWVYDFTSKEEKQLTKGAGNKENPTWAPNGLCLAYNTTDQEACELYLISLTQPEATKISAEAGEKRFPNWEPRPEKSHG